MSKRSLPWLQFYPADWKSDAVAGCSLAAQGLWLNMMFAMHQSQSYGRLEVEGRPIPDEVLFRRLGCVSVEEYRTLLDELFAAGVPSRDSDGIIYSRRMVRDQQERDATAERVRRHRDRVACNASVTPMSQGEVRGQKSEVRDQKSEKEKKAASPPAATAKAAQPVSASPGFEEFWKLYPRKEAKKDAICAWKKVQPDEVPMILTTVGKRKVTEDWQRENGRYIPLPATFLNGRRWEDQVSEPSSEEIPFVEPYR